MIGIYSNFDEFSKVAQEMGVKDDLQALLSLNLVFFERYDEYSIVSVRDYSDAPNNVLVLSKDKTILYSEKKITERDFRLFKYTVQKAYGESTALTLLVLKEVLASYAKYFEKINSLIDSFSSVKDSEGIEQTAVDLRKLTVNVEDFQNLLYTLEDRKVREFRTEYLEYDYDLILARTRHLLGRCRSHLQELRDVRSEIELKNAYQFNLRLEELTKIMKRLTGLTVLFMIPTLIASFYGMNFVFMPELAHPLGYPGVIVVMASATLLTAFWMHRKGWL